MQKAKSTSQIVLIVFVFDTSVHVEHVVCFCNTHFNLIYCGRGDGICTDGATTCKTFILNSSRQGYVESSCGSRRDEYYRLAADLEGQDTIGHCHSTVRDRSCHSN